MVTPLGKHERPMMVLANTIKGKGLDFMEGEAYWHHQVPKGAQADEALKVLHQREQELFTVIKDQRAD